MVNENRERKKRRRSRSPSPASKDPNDTSKWPYWLAVTAIAAVVVLPSDLSLIGSASSLPREKGLRSPLAESKIDMLCMPNFDDEHFFDAFKVRRSGLRYRDDLTLARLAYQNQQNPATVNPVIVSDRRATAMPPGGGTPTTSASGDRNRNDPTLEDIDLIDVLWRSDIEVEKGQVASLVAPSEQYERDLQLLTEKSIQAPLTREESNRFEDLSKVYYEDFYAPRGRYAPTAADFVEKTYPSKPTPTASEASTPVTAYSPVQQEQSKRELSTPTDADLDALFEDMVKESGELGRVTALEAIGMMTSSTTNNAASPASVIQSAGTPVSAPQDNGPLIQNVSLATTATYNANNLTDLDYMVREGFLPAPLVPGALPAVPIQNQSTTYNETTRFWFTENSESTYQNREAMLNMTALNMTLNAPQEPVAPAPQLTQLTGRPNYNERPSRPSVSVSMSSNSNSSSVCSSSSSSSPRYNSETENRSPKFRYAGKLVPQTDEDEEYDAEAFNAPGEEVKPFGESRNTPSLGGPSVIPRRRGRQSKDEQLAAVNRLPVSAQHIADMSLPDLQKLLKSDSLNEAQKQLIRKIRRRGKNKVAARTCRQRRTETRSAQMDIPQGGIRYRPAY